MHRSEKMAIYQQFLTMINQKCQMDIKEQLLAFLDYSEYSIKSEVDKTNKKPNKNKKKKQQFGQRILEAYNSQTTIEKIQEYIRIVRFLKELKEGKEVIEEIKGEKIFQDAYSLSYAIRVWKKKLMRVDMTSGEMFCQRDKKVKFYDLKNYLIRESKNTDYRCFVLQAINTKPHHKSMTVRIGFKNNEKFKECYECVKATVHKMERQRIKQQLGIVSIQSHPQGVILAPSGTKNIIQESTKKQQNKTQQKIKRLQDDEQLMKQLQDSIIDASSFRSEIRKGEDSQEQQEDIETISLALLDCDNNEQMYSIVQKQSEMQNYKKQNLDVFHQIVPDYDLSNLQDQMEYQLITRQNKGRVLKHKQQPLRYKVFIETNTQNASLIFQTLTRVQNYIKWNTAVEQVLIKSILKTQNVAVIYQKHKAMNKVYRARDFVFMRHAFKKDNNLYFLDKTIQNASYPPFLTIVRGDLQIVWGIIKKEKGHLIVCDVEMENQGYINQAQNHSLSMLYLKGLLGMQQYLQSPQNLQIVCNIFNLNWDISKKTTKNKIKSQQKLQKSGDKVFKKVKAEKKKQEQLNSSEEKDRKIVRKKSIEYEKSGDEGKLMQKQIQKLKSTEGSESTNTRKNQSKGSQTEEVTDSLPEVNQPSKQCLTSIQYQLGNDGLVLIPQLYLKNKYYINYEPPKPISYQQAIQGHPIWKGEWRVDTKNGGIIFINQQKINDQKGVLKFILSKIAKNLLSGKSVLNISLPVDIFGYETNLERLALSMTYAPIMLEKAATFQDPIERLKIITAFGLTNSAIYLSMQKPFNSILGQTFQGWMNGCPIYMEQISHHPPIAAFILLGRGYKMTGTLQSKVQLHMNSGCGTNQGVYRILMDDGSDYNFITPGGQIAGISYGDRKFNLVGKYFIWSKKHRLFLQLQMDPCSKKGFLSKRQHLTDYMQGDLKQVTIDFLNKFQKQKPKQKEGPNKIQTLRIIQRVNGTWHKTLFFNNKQYLDLDNEFGCKLEYDEHLLPSDGNWREDLIYRRRKDIVRAQTQKERLQNLQRADRKLREKFHGNKH